MVQVDQILQRGGCSDDGQSGTYECPSGMMGLCQLYVKNKEVVSCKQKVSDAILRGSDSGAPWSHCNIRSEAPAIAPKKRTLRRAHCRARIS